MRRLIRLGLWSGFLAAIGLGLKRLFEAPRPEPAGDRWRAAEPPAPLPTPRSGPVLPIVEPEIVEVGDVDQPGEPEVGTIDPEPPEAPPEHGTAKTAAPRKAAAKKAPTKTTAAKTTAARTTATKKAPTKKAAGRTSSGGADPKSPATAGSTADEPPEPVQ